VDISGINDKRLIYRPIHAPNHEPEEYKLKQSG
jgi:hypothetical protein